MDMKRGWGLILAIALLLGGCRPASDPNGVLGNGEIAASASIDEAALRDIPYSYANTLKGVPGGSMCDVGRSILFAAQGQRNATLFLYEKATGAVSYFCKDATCTHDPDNVARDADCAARGGSGNLEVADGHVFGEYTVVNKEHIDTYSAVLRDGRFVETAGPGASMYRHQDGETYAITTDGALVRLTSGEPQVICEEFPHSTVMVMDGYGYTVQNRQLIRISLADGERQIVVPYCEGAFTCDGVYLYYFDENYYMHRCLPDGSESVSLTDFAIWPPSVNFRGDCIYYAPYPDGDNLSGVWAIGRMKADGSAAEEWASVPSRPQDIYAFAGCEQLFVNTANGLYTVDIASGATAAVVLP